MNENIRKRNELLAGKVIKGLASRNMTGYYAADREEDLEVAVDPFFRCAVSVIVQQCVQRCVAAVADDLVGGHEP